MTDDKWKVGTSSHTLKIKKKSRNLVRVENCDKVVTKYVVICTGGVKKEVTTDRLFLDLLSQP